MELYTIAKALSTVLEIKNGDSPATASFHLGAGGDIDINVYPNSDDLDHFYSFSAYPQFSDYKMEEHYWHIEGEDEEEHRILSKKTFKTFDEMVQEIREMDNEQDYLQEGRRRCRLSSVTTFQA